MSVNADRPADAVDAGAAPAAATDESAASASATSLLEDPASLLARLDDSSSQVASLNAKLVAAYERIGDQDDAFEACQSEIAALRQRNGILEAERAAWEERVEGGLLVEKVCLRCPVASLTGSGPRAVGARAHDGSRAAGVGRARQRCDSLIVPL